MSPVFTSFAQEIRRLPGPVWTLSTGIFIDRFGAFIMPFLVLFLNHSGASDTLAGWAVGLVGVGGLSAAFLGGYLADCFGRRNTIVISMIGSSLCGLGIYASVAYAEELGGLWLTLFLAMMYGLIRGMYFPASSSLIADVVPSENRVAAFAVLRFAINLGWALGMVAAGYLSEISYLLLFLIDSTTSMIYGIIAWRKLPHGIRVERNHAGWKPAFRAIGRDPRFIIVCVNSLMLAVMFAQWSTSYPRMLQDFRDFVHPERVFGIIMAINGFVIALVELPISAVVRRFSPPKMIALGSLFSAVGFGFNAWALSYTGLILCMLVFTIGEMISMPVQGAYVSQLAPENMRGRYNGMLGLMWSSSTVFGPAMGLWLLGVGPEVLCWVMLVMGCGSAALLYWSRTGDSET